MNFFQDKKTSILVVALVLIVVLLLLVLLTNLAQMAMMNQKVERLKSTIEQQQQLFKDEQEWLEYMKSNQYVIDWAKKEGLVNDNELVWRQIGE